MLIGQGHFSGFPSYSGINSRFFELRNFTVFRNIYDSLLLQMLKNFVIYTETAIQKADKQLSLRQ